AAESEILITAHRRIRGITAGDNRVHGRINFDQLLERFLAAHSTGQRKVENHRIESFAGFELLSVGVYAVERGRGSRYLIPKVRKSEIDQGANRILVVHHQY